MQARSGIRLHSVEMAARLASLLFAGIPTRPTRRRLSVP
jgi:hypothetical protein